MPECPPGAHAASPKEGSCPLKPPSPRAGVGWDAARGRERAGGCFGCLLGTPGRSLWGVRGTGCREAVATERAAGNWPVVGSVLAWGGKPELFV